MTPLHRDLQVLDEDQFVERFGPRPNHLDLTAGFDCGEGGCLFACAGKELRYVLAQKPSNVWTLLEGDEGQLVIESGMHIVNRLGYLITERPIDEHAVYTVPIDDT